MRLFWLALWTGLVAASLSAGSLQVQVTQLGSNSFRFTYVLSNYTFQANQELAIQFDPTLYASLSNPMAPSGFSVVLLQPNNPPGTVGYYSARALVNNPSLVGPFSVDFMYLGTGYPGAQSFTVNQLDQNGNLEAAAVDAGYTSSPFGFTPNSLQPTIASISPTVINAGGPVTVTAAGTNFQSGLSVSVKTDAGTIPASNVVVTPTQVEFQVAMSASSPVPPYWARVVITNPDGTNTTGNVQVGLPGPQPVMLPEFVTGGGFVTGIYIDNLTGQAAKFSINFYDHNGKPAAIAFGGAAASSSLSDTIPANGAAYYETTGQDGTLVDGSAVISAGPGISVQGLIRRHGSDGSYYEAAVPTGTGSNEFEIAFDDTTFTATGDQVYTGVAIANLDTVNSATVTCIARDSQGNIIPNAVFVPVLNPLGHWASSAFPPLMGKRGTLDCTSNALVGAVSLRALGSNAISSLPVVASGGTDPSSGVILPEYVSGGGFATGLYVINTGDQPAKFSINFYTASGTPALLSFNDSSLGSTLSGTIPARGVGYYEMADSLGPLADGAAMVAADPSIVIQGLVRRHGSDGSYYEAAVPAAMGGKEFEIAFDATTFATTGDQVYTGIAIANMDPLNSATVTCTARDAQGNLIPNAVFVPVLSPLGHWAQSLFPPLIGKRGTVDCTSTTTIGAISLRALGNNSISVLPVTPVGTQKQ